MASRLTRSSRAGWAFAMPGFGLIAIFIILPFFFAFYFSLTNQRLVSPNPTEWVGLQNYRDLLGVGVLTLEPERDDAGAILRDDNGAIEALRQITDSPVDLPQPALAVDVVAILRTVAVARGPCDRCDDGWSLHFPEMREFFLQPPVTRRRDVVLDFASHDALAARP